MFNFCLKYFKEKEYLYNFILFRSTASSYSRKTTTETTSSSSRRSSGDDSGSNTGPTVSKFRRF